MPRMLNPPTVPWEQFMPGQADPLDFLSGDADLDPRRLVWDPAQFHGMDPVRAAQARSSMAAAAPVAAAAPPVAQGRPQPQPPAQQFPWERYLPGSVDAADFPGSAEPPVLPLRADVDRSRGLSGADWVRSQAAGPGGPSRVDLPVAPSPGGEGVLFSGTGTQADYEGRLRAKGILDALYPDEPDFDPYEARIQDADARAALKLAEQRAEDPVAFARTQAGIGEEARVDARIGGGHKLYAVLGKFQKDKAGLVAAQAQIVGPRRPTNPDAAAAWEAYQRATPEARKAMLEDYQAKINEIDGHARVLMQSMGFGFGQTPGQLYSETLGG